MQYMEQMRRSLETGDFKAFREAHGAGRATQGDS
jgi:hypothetical protein